MTRLGNRIGNGNEGRVIIHAEGVWRRRWADSDIIRAEGVRGGFLSSAPQARTAPGMVDPIGGEAPVALPGLGEPVDLVA